MNGVAKEGTAVRQRTPSRIRWFFCRRYRDRRAI